MRPYLITLALAAAITAPALADAPKANIRGPVRMAADGTIVLDARASVADRPLRWKLDGPDVPFLTLDQDGRRGVVALVPSAPPGIYRFTVIALGIPEGATEVDADAAIHIVTVEASPPPVPFPPGPSPDPTPTPVSGPLHVSLILDLDGLTPDLARLRESPRAREAFETINVAYRTYAKSSPDVNRLNLLAPAEKVGFPALVIQDETGRIVWSGRAPGNEDELIARVKSLRGGS